MSADFILTALNTQAATLALPTAWENKNGFSPPSNAIWIRPTFLPTPPEAAAIGANAADVHQGIYQIDVFDPTSSGDGPARAIAESIIAAFPRGAVLAYSGQLVRVEKSYRLSGRNESDTATYHIPVRIEWRAEV